MPGSIRVSVLEAVDLPAAVIAGNHVTVKVTLGKREYKTEPGNLNGGKTARWNSDFAFPVLNLRDKLVVAVCDNKDEAVTHTDIEVPSIVERGYRDEFVAFKGGGRIHLKLSFSLTDEERKKIELMRVASLKRRAHENLKNTVIYQEFQPTVDNRFTPYVVPRATLTEVVDLPTDEGENGNKENERAVVGFVRSGKPRKSRPTFDYAKAVGLRSIGKRESVEKEQPTQGILPKVKSDLSEAVASPNMEEWVHVKSPQVPTQMAKPLPTNLVKASLSPLVSGRVAVALPNTTNAPVAEGLTVPPSRNLAGSAGSPVSRNMSTTSAMSFPPSPATPPQQESSISTLPPSMQGHYIGRVTKGIVKARIQALESTLRQEPESNSSPTRELQEVKWQAERERASERLQTEGATLGVAENISRKLEEKLRDKGRGDSGSNQVSLQEQIRRLDFEVLNEGEEGMLQNSENPELEGEMKEKQLMVEEARQGAEENLRHTDFGQAMMEATTKAGQCQPQGEPIKKKEGEEGSLHLSRADCKDASDLKEHKHALQPKNKSPVALTESLALKEFLAKRGFSPRSAGLHPEPKRNLQNAESQPGVGRTVSQSEVSPAGGRFGARTSGLQQVLDPELQQLPNSQVIEEARVLLDGQGLSNKMWQALAIIADEILCTPGKIQRLDSGPGPEARWAQKNSIDSRWASPAASPEKAKLVTRDESSRPTGESTELQRAKAKLMQLFSAVTEFVQNQSQSDDQSLQEYIAGIGGVVNKVVGAAAAVLAALFILWPRDENPGVRYPSANKRETISIKVRQSTDQYSRSTKVTNQLSDENSNYPGQRLHLS